MQNVPSSMYSLNNQSSATLEVLMNAPSYAGNLARKLLETEGADGPLKTEPADTLPVMLDQTMILDLTQEI